MVRPWHKALVVALLPVRVVLDGFAWPVGPWQWSPARLLTAAMALVLVVVWIAHARRVVAFPLRAPFAAWTLVVCASAAVAPVSVVGGVATAKLLWFVVWVVAVWAVDLRDIPESWWVASAFPPLLVWSYGNPHSAALVAAVSCVVAVHRAVDARGWMWWGVAAVNGGIVLTSGVHVAMLSVLVGGLLARPGAVSAKQIAGWSAFGAAVLAVLGSAHDGQWLALGSWRPRIWLAATNDWLASGAWAVAWGNGPGSHWSAHRHLDPHSDVLAVAMQTGLVGVCALGWVVGAAWRMAWRANDRLAMALLAAGVATAAVSNAAIERPTVMMWTWGVVGVTCCRAAAEFGATARQREV